MEFLKAALGLPNDHLFTYERIKFQGTGNIWLAVLRNVLNTNPHHFKGTKEEKRDDVIDFNLENSCHPQSVSRTNDKANIQNGFFFNERTGFSLNDQPEHDSYSAGRKVDTAVMCRLMDTGSDIMQCPTTYIVSPFQNEIAEFKREAANTGGQWIWKPDCGTHGANLMISSNISAIEEHALDRIELATGLGGSRGTGGVIQRVLPKPFLVEGKRFSIRMHAGVVNREPFWGFMSSHSFVALAAGSDNTNTVEDSSIITNVHFNTGIVNGFSQKSLMEYLSKQNLLSVWLNQTLPVMGRGLQEFLSKEHGLSAEPTRRFELYGCDILVDEDLHPWLLECNRCAGVKKFLKNRIALYEEFAYILLYSRYKDNKVPLLNYWQPFIQQSG